MYSTVPRNQERTYKRIGILPEADQPWNQDCTPRRHNFVSPCNFRRRHLLNRRDGWMGFNSTEGLWLSRLLESHTRYHRSPWDLICAISVLYVIRVAVLRHVCCVFLVVVVSGRFWGLVLINRGRRGGRVERSGCCRGSGRWNIYCIATFSWFVMLSTSFFCLCPSFLRVCELYDRTLALEDLFEKSIRLVLLCSPRKGCRWDRSVHNNVSVMLSRRCLSQYCSELQSQMGWRGWQGILAFWGLGRKENTKIVRRETTVSYRYSSLPCLPLLANSLCS